MPPLPSYLSTLGIAKEAIPGTAIAPTSFLRYTDFKPKAAITYLDDDAVRGSMAGLYDKVQGVTHAELDLSVPVYADEIGWLFASLLNDLAVTGASDPFTTTFALLNSGNGQPTSYTLTDFNANNARAFAGCMASDLSVKFSADGLATATAKLLGMSYATAATPTTSYGATTALPSWGATASLAGSSSALVTAAEFAVKRTVTPVPALNGSQAPAAMFAAGDLTVSGNLTVVYDASQGETVYGYYLNGTKVALVLDLISGANREVKLTSTKAQFTDCAIERGKGQYSTLNIAFDAVANSTDVGASAGYSPLKVTTKSPTATGTYK